MSCMCTLRIRFLCIDTIFFAGKLEMSTEQKTQLLDIFADNPFQKLCDQFKTYYHVDKHVRNTPEFKFIQPQEIELPEPKRHFSYISVIDTLATIVSDPTFKQETKEDAGYLRDIKDGLAYKENAFFSKNPDAFTLLFYSDALELCNPLGARKGVHKVVNGYFTIAELPKFLRARTENIFLAFSVKEKDLKDYTLQVYQPLLEDLGKLEKGVDIGGKIVKVC